MGSQGVEKRRKELKVTKREQPHTKENIPCCKCTKITILQIAKEIHILAQGRTQFDSFIL